MASFVLKGKTFPVSRALTKRVSWYMPTPSPKVLSRNEGRICNCAEGNNRKMTVCKQTEDVHTNIWAQAVCKRVYVQI